MLKSRWLKILLTVLTVAIAWWYNSSKKSEFESKGNAAGHQSIPTVKHNPQLIYTKHAKCRMDCRHVDESEVVEIIQAGFVNEKKSNRSDTPCPTVAYEGTSHDGQHLRIVVADCEPVDKIVTVIDLETDFKCDCY